MENHSLVSLYDFENRNAIFPGVHRSYKFCLLTLTGQGRPASKGAKFAFFLQDTQELKRDDKIFSLTATDLKSINPNTRTCPIFRTRYDAELTKKIYRRVPVLINENTGENPWEISFKQGLFNMTSDSHLFRTRKELEAEGYELKGNIFVRAGADVYLPMYEAKMIWQFDHRFGSYEGLSKRPQNAPLIHPTGEQYTRPSFIVQSWYWVPAKEVLKMATINGANILDNSHNSGKLEINQKADLITIDIDNIQSQPLYNMFSQLVYSIESEQIKDVIIDGKTVLINRKLVNVDESELLQKAKYWRDKIITFYRN
jgi:hypothetical protein